MKARTVRINLWDFTNDNEKNWVDELSQNKCLNPFSQGQLGEYIAQKIRKEVDNLVKAGVILTEDSLLLSVGIYTNITEFNSYEKFKNTFDAKGSKVDLYISFESEDIQDKKLSIENIKNNVVIVTYIDNGEGLAKLSHDDSKESLKNKEGAIPYLKIMDPNIDPTLPPSDKNILTQRKIISSKQSRQKPDDDNHQTGGHGLGIRGDAILEWETKTHCDEEGGQFFIIDNNDLRKSEKLLKLTGITVSEVPPSGTALIHLSKIYTLDLQNHFITHYPEKISKPGSLEHGYYSYITPKDRDLELNKILDLNDSELTDFTLVFPNNESSNENIEIINLSDISTSDESLVSPPLKMPSDNKIYFSPSSEEYFFNPSIKTNKNTLFDAFKTEEIDIITQRIDEIEDKLEKKSTFKSFLKKEAYSGTNRNKKINEVNFLKIIRNNLKNHSLKTVIEDSKLQYPLIYKSLGLKSRGLLNTLLKKEKIHLKKHLLRSNRI